MIRFPFENNEQETLNDDERAVKAAARRDRLVVRRETLDDLLLTDVG